MKVCLDCKETKEDTEFYWRHKARNQTENHCKQCSGKRKRALRRQHWEANPAAHKRHLERAAAALRRRRSEGHNAAGTFLNDSRKNDRRNNRANDLTKEFVSEMFKQPCSYCGDCNGKKSLDRVDNTLGHLQDNVVTCCVRCNLVRGQMPYQAWLVVAEGMKVARERGLFGDWDGNILRKKK